MSRHCVSVETQGENKKHFQCGLPYHGCKPRGRSRSSRNSQIISLYFSFEGLSGLRVCLRPHTKSTPGCVLPSVTELVLTTRLAQNATSLSQSVSSSLSVVVSLLVLSSSSPSPSATTIATTSHSSMRVAVARANKPMRSRLGVLYIVAWQYDERFAIVHDMCVTTVSGWASQRPQAETRALVSCQGMSRFCCIGYPALAFFVCGDMTGALVPSARRPVVDWLNYPTLPYPPTRNMV
eukprot:scaffold2987_cov170-Amphora_coffeaeformis.AAC.26